MLLTLPQIFIDIVLGKITIYKCIRHFGENQKHVNNDHRNGNMATSIFEKISVQTIVQSHYQVTVQF